jgi:membrane-associated phospholipid phosphatase
LFAAGAVLLVAVVGLGVQLKSVEGPLRPDSFAARTLAQRGASRPAERSKFDDVARLGSEISIVVSVAMLASWAATRRDWRALAVAILGPATALFLTEFVLKPLVDRESPLGALSYPSGHAAVVASLVTAALLFVYRYVGPRFALLWSPYAVAVVGAVALAVVALRWHYITDAVGGVGLGIGVVLVAAAAADSIRSTNVDRPLSSS